MRDVGFLSSPAKTNLLVPSVIVGIIEKPALRIAVSGSEIGTLGFAGAYKSATYGAFVFPSNFRVYQKGITSRTKSALFSASGSAVFME